MWASFWNIYDGPSGAPKAKLKSTAKVTRATNEAGEDNGGGRRIEDFTKYNLVQSSNAKQIANPQPAADKTTILRGVIIGEEKSGKTSLIRRLRGENPFQQPENSESITRETSGKLMALLPWRLPNEAPFHQSQGIESDGLVQLYVSEGKSFCYSRKPNLLKKQMKSLFSQPQRGKELDFAVWMVDPRMEKVRDFVQEGLEILFPSVTEQGGSLEGKDTLAETSPLIIQHVCILINFRDVFPAEQHRDSNEVSLLKQLQLVVKNVVARYNERYEKHRRPDSSDLHATPTILVYESSTKKCYGLQNFHSFIALPYLLRKERDLKQRLEQTHEQRLAWESVLMEAKDIDYGEFMKQRVGEKEQSQLESLHRVSNERQNPKEEKERLETYSVRQHETSRTTAENHEVSNLFGKYEEDEVHRSAVATNPSDQPKVFVKRQLISDAKKAASTASGHSTLESFFSDDEDDEDDQTEIETSDTSDSAEGYDSDDGDFYIDGSGARCVHANLPERSKQSSLKPAITPRRQQKANSVESLKAENNSSVIHEAEENHYSSNGGGNDEITVTLMGVDNQMSFSEGENSIDNTYPVEQSSSSAERATGSQIFASGVSDNQDNKVKHALVDADVSEKSKSCVSIVPPVTNPEEGEEDRSSLDATITLGDLDGTPTSIEQLPEGSIVLTVSEPISEQTQRDSNDTFKSTPVESEIESGVTNDENCDKHGCEDRDRAADEHLVLNSDEESICQSSKGYGCRDCDDIDEELNNPNDVNQDSTTNLTMPRRTGDRGKTSPVSSAALAAIEAAKIEAEKRMAQSQSDVPQVRRERKSKKKGKDEKKNDKEGKKKKKKDKEKDKKCQDTHSLDSVK